MRVRALSENCQWNPISQQAKLHFGIILLGLLSSLCVPRKKNSSNPSDTKKNTGLVAFGNSTCNHHHNFNRIDHLRRGKNMGEMKKSNILGFVTKKKSNTR